MFHVEHFCFISADRPVVILKKVPKHGKMSPYLQKDGICVEKKGKIIAIANQKGGVGKTTTAVNLAAALGAHGYSVLLCDIDPQGNATSGFGIEKRNLKGSSYDLIIGESTASEVILKTKFKGVSVIPVGMELAGAEVELVEVENRESRLKMAVSGQRDKFDCIFFDCPPSLGLLTLNGLCAADTVLVPIQCEYYALEGLSQLMNTIRQVKRRYNENIDIEGVLLTMFDGRLNLTMQVVEEIKKYFPQKVYSTTIPRNVRVSEAPSYGEPIMYYDRFSRGAAAYEEFCKEFIKNNNMKGDAK